MDEELKRLLNRAKAMVERYEEGEDIGGESDLIRDLAAYAETNDACRDDDLMWLRARALTPTDPKNGSAGFLVSPRVFELGKLHATPLKNLLHPMDGDDEAP